MQREFDALKQAEKESVTQLFSQAGGLDSLHKDGIIDAKKDIQLPINPSQVIVKPGWRQHIFGQARN